jgi:predicted ATPase
VAGGQPLEVLPAAIGDRRLLVVLDNLEQVAAAGGDIAALLAGCPGMTILATSRVRLRVRGEQEYAVLPLPLPLPGSGLNASRALASLTESPAVNLFVRRAQAARPDFQLTAGNADAVVAICRRLDGLPLAIELAAARVRMLTPGELLRRLARPLDVLGVAAADLPERQRTLRATIAWSYDLLAPDECRVFRRLSVFPGGWSLAAAELVSGNGPVLEALGGLIDQSLVSARRGGVDGETRFTMLETIREFAAEQLLTSGEQDAAQRALEAYLLDLVEAAERGFLGPEQMAWLDRLQADHDNLRAALASSLERGETGTALALASALAPFWRARGFAAEGVRWLERSLDSSGDAPAAACAAALDALGGLLIDLGEFARADRAFRDSVDHWLKLGERRAVARGLFALSIAKSNSGDVAGAQDALEESLAIAQDLDDERGVAAALHNLGMLAREAGDLDRAVSLLGEALMIWRRLHDAHWIGVAAGNLGDAFRLAGEPERARVFIDESERRYASLGDRFGLGVVANQRGLLDQAGGRDAGAMQRHAEALRHFDAVQAPLGVIESIEWLAVAAAGGPYARDALRLFGATEAARAARGLAPLAADAAPIAAGLAWARQAVGADAEALLAEGAAMPLDAARDAALTLAGTRRQS